MMDSIRKKNKDLLTTESQKKNNKITIQKKLFVSGRSTPIVAPNEFRHKMHTPPPGGHQFIPVLATKAD